MHKCHYFICTSLLISVSLVSLIFQNRCLLELMAGFDQYLTVQILNCINSSLYLSEVKMALFLTATFEFLFSKKTSWCDICDWGHVFYEQCCFVVISLSVWMVPWLHMWIRLLSIFILNILQIASYILYFISAWIVIKFELFILYRR